MADIESSTFTILSGDGTVAALVGTRIYPLVVPQDVALPAISYQKISGVREYAHDAPLGFASVRIQVNCVDDDYDGAKALAAAVRGAMSGYSGTATGLDIHAMFMDNEVDSYGRDDKYFLVRQDYLITHGE